jgi:hypothetical protein
LCTPERQSLCESHRQRRWLTYWSYTVNPDCTGTYTVLSDGLSFSIFIAPNGAELIVIATKPGYVIVQGPNRRVSRE